MIDDNIVETNKNILEYLELKFNILYISNTLNFDENYQRLCNELLSIKKDSFLPNDRIMIEFFDLDYYENFLKTGLHIRNIIECFKSCGIPMFTLMIITNNFEMKTEVDILLEDWPAEDRPTIITTLSSKLTFEHKDHYQPVDIDADSIKKHAVCLMSGNKKLHRFAMFDFFKSNNLLEKVGIGFKHD
jgi:hypothetical protein